MVQSDYFDHTAPGGQSFAPLVLTSYVPPGDYYKVGQNIGYGTGALSTPAHVVADWMNSPEHRANILDPDYRQTGVGVVAGVPPSLSSLPGATYTQDFGVYGSSATTVGGLR